MQRSKSSELGRLRADLIRCRLAVNLAREELIEALGDWICDTRASSGGSRPSEAAIEELARLCALEADAEAALARCVAERYVERMNLRCRRSPS